VISELFERIPNVKRVANISATGSMRLIISGTLKVKYWITIHTDARSARMLSIRSRKSTIRNRNTNIERPMPKFLIRREKM
jgi:hypothetical protein